MKAMSYVTFKIAGKSVGTMRIEHTSKVSEQNIIESASLLSQKYFGSTASPDTICKERMTTDLEFEIYAVFVDDSKTTLPAYMPHKLYEYFMRKNWFRRLLQHTYTVRGINPIWWNYPIGNFKDGSTDNNNKWQIERLVNLMFTHAKLGVLEVDYTNYAGRRSLRTVTLRWPPRFDSDKYHPEPQWLMDVYCHDRDEKRTFALSNIHGWRVPQ